MLSCVTADYRTAGFDLLERLSTVDARLVTRVVDEQPGLDGAVLLTTCNRFEAYLDVPDEAAAEAGVRALLTAVGRATGVAEDEIVPALRRFEGDEVAGHLFAVSSGLESVVLGEGEIAGQVSRALEVARAASTTTAGLERVFQRAAHTSSAVQNGTRLGGAGRSIVRLALDLVESRIGDWSDAAVLLIGTGSYAGATLAALRDRGVTSVSVFSPSGRAARFAGREGVTAVEPDALDRVLATADLVIACSVASVPVLDADRLRKARAAGGGTGPRMVIDLGLPRNICPDVAELGDVDLLDLETISVHAPLPDFQAGTEARALIGRAVDEYRAAQDAAAVTPGIIAFRGHVSELADAEIERLRRRGESSPAAEKALKHLASVLVHSPSVRGREFAASGQAERFTAALETVFGLELEPSAPAGPARLTAVEDAAAG